MTTETSTDQKSVIDQIMALRLPVALVLLAVNALWLLVGIVQLLVPVDPGTGAAELTFAQRSTAGYGSFVTLATVVLPLAAAIVATWPPALRQARLVLMLALASYGISAVFGLVTFVGGIFLSETVINTAGQAVVVTKYQTIAENAVRNIGWMVLLLLAAFLVLRQFLGSRPAQPAQPISGGWAPGQPMPGQPMPGQPMPGQPVQGQPVPGQPYGQPAASAAAAAGTYGQPAAQQSGPPYAQTYGQGQTYGQTYGQAQPAAPQPPQPQAYGQQTATGQTYGQTTATGQTYGQAQPAAQPQAYGQPPAPTAYGQQGQTYGQPTSGQPTQYGQAPPAAPAYGQPPAGQPTPGQPTQYGQTPPAAPAYGQPQQTPGYGQDLGAYGQSAGVEPVSGDVLPPVEDADEQRTQVVGRSGPEADRLPERTRTWPQQ